MDRSAPTRRDADAPDVAEADGLSSPDMKRTLGTVVTLVAALILGLPMSASAGEAVDPNIGDTVLGTSGGLRYARDPALYDAISGYANAEAGCGGPRWHLIGGGSEAGGASADAWLVASRPVDFHDSDLSGDDGWYAGGYGPDGSRHTAYSICIRDRMPRYRQRTVADSPSGDRTGSMGCGDVNWHVTTGGVFIATSQSWTNSSSPRDGGDADGVRDDGWTGRVWDTIGGNGGFYVYAVCAKGLAVHYVHRPPITLVAGETEPRRANCASDEHVVGGGAFVTGPADEARMVSSRPFDDADADNVPDDGWVSRVHGIAGSDKNVTAYAICLG
jgi:hypothetical protein